MKVRQTRSDKKRDVKPTIPIELYECIHRISYLSTRPIKNVVEEICIEGLKSKQVMDYLSTYFRRDFWATPQLLFRGSPYIEKAKLPGLKRRISTRFCQHEHDRLAALAYSLDHTVSYAAALLLHATVKNAEIIDMYITNNIEYQLSPSKKNEFKKILRFINKNNPYEEEISISILVNYLVDEVVNGTESVKEALSTWIDNKKTKNQ